MKRFITTMLAIVLVLEGFCAYAHGYDTAQVISEASEYILKTACEPTVSSTGGEWAVIGLARGDIDVPEGYFDIYYKNLEQVLREKDGVLHTRKYTEYSRVILALTAIGKNPRNVAGYDLLLPLADLEKTVWQGINGAAFALIALDCGNYETAIGATREDYVGYILERQLADGGWSLAGNSSDPDITAMVLQALSNYTEEARVSDAVDKALSCMSLLQTSNAGFVVDGSECSESAAQMIVALCELGIPLEDERFVKNGKTLLDNLMSFKIGGGFRHSASSFDINQMSTEQAFYSIIAVKRAVDGKCTLYDMSDAVKTDTPDTEASGTDIAVKPILYSGKTFPDIVGCRGRASVEALAQRGIVNGRSDTVFDPRGNVSRAELAAIIVRGLGLTEKGIDIFSDVTADDWFYGCIGSAYSCGIIKGVSDTSFDPYGTLTRQEAAVMIARAAALCGMSTEMTTLKARSTLSCFDDYVKAAPWAFDSLAFCVGNGIIIEDGAEIHPTSVVTREELCVMLYNMLTASGLIVEE